MYDFTRSSQFKKDVKRCKKQGKDMSKFKLVHKHLVSGKALPKKYQDHSLTGNYNKHRECHLEPDWLLIYRRNKKQKLIEYVRMGSHTELFKM
jgi:mRNA interferase YafQ